MNDGSFRCEVYSLSRTTGAKTKELQARLGDPQKLQAVDDAKGFIAERMTPKLKTRAREAGALADKKNLAAQYQRDQSDAVISAYEARVAKLEKEKLVAEERSAKIVQPREAGEDLFQLAFIIPASSYYICKNFTLTMKKKS